MGPKIFDVVEVMGDEQPCSVEKLQSASGEERAS